MVNKGLRVLSAKACQMLEFLLQNKQLYKHDKLMIVFSSQLCWISKYMFPTTLSPSITGIKVIDTSYLLFQQVPFPIRTHTEYHILKRGLLHHWHFDLPESGFNWIAGASTYCCKCCFGRSTTSKFSYYNLFKVLLLPAALCRWIDNIPDSAEFCRRQTELVIYASKSLYFPVQLDSGGAELNWWESCNAIPISVAFIWNSAVSMWYW